MVFLAASWLAVATHVFVVAGWVKSNFGWLEWLLRPSRLDLQLLLGASKRYYDYSEAYTYD